MATKHTVIAPLVVATQEDGSALYLYAGAPVLGSISSDEVDRLIEGGFIAEVVEESAFPEGDPTAEWKLEQLKAYAEAKSIDLGDAKKKDELLAVLVPAK